MVRKQTVTSLKAEPVILQCHKGDGKILFDHNLL